MVRANRTMGHMAKGKMFEVVEDQGVWIILSGRSENVEGRGDASEWTVRDYKGDAGAKKGRTKETASKSTPSRRQKR